MSELKVKNIGPIDDYVYDISLDGTVVNALGCNVASNTDGFNFQMPPEEELAKRHYVGKGMNRETKEGKEYTGYEADVAEFNDLFMRHKMGLGIDEIIASSINVSRKNYADRLYNPKTGQYDLKLVGNTLKSKKMPQYIEEFLDEAIPLLLVDKGHEFIELYYRTLSLLYEQKMPVYKLASKGKIKKTMQQYLDDCNTKTAKGRFKSRQAWYELAIANNLLVNVGDTVYYVNTGKKKNTSDVKFTRDVDPVTKEQLATGKLEFNCQYIEPSVIENKESVDIDYNTAKYIEAFNNRVLPLTVCFDKSIRDNIIVKNPKNRGYFTESETKLVHGQPLKEGQQDSVEEILTLDDREIEFWLHKGVKPVFCDECGFDWDKIVDDYHARMEILKTESVKKIVDIYHGVINKMSGDELMACVEESHLPETLQEIVVVKPGTKDIYAKEFDVKIGTWYDFVDRKYELDSGTVIADNFEQLYNEVW